MHVGSLRRHDTVSTSRPSTNVLCCDNCYHCPSRKPKLQRKNNILEAEDGVKSVPNRAGTRKHIGMCPLNDKDDR